MDNLISIFDVIFNSNQNFSIAHNTVWLWAQIQFVKKMKVS